MMLIALLLRLAISVVILNYLNGNRSTLLVRGLLLQRVDLRITTIHHHFLPVFIGGCHVAVWVFIILLLATVVHMLLSAAADS